MILQPNPWSCYPTALACCTGLDLGEILRVIGHDGSRVIQPEKPDPWCREAFLFEEIAFAAFSFGWALTRVYVDTLNRDGSRRPGFLNRPGGFLGVLDCKAIVEVQRGTEEDPRWHALIYDGRAGTIYDPLTGETRTLDGYESGPCWPISIVCIPSRIDTAGVFPIFRSARQRATARVA